MGGEEDSAAGLLPGGRRTFWRSASWSASRTAALDHSRECASQEKNASNGPFKHRSVPPLTPKPQNQKARPCLPPLQPLAITRRSLDEWPKAGSDDIGEWPNPLTPGAKPDAHKLGDSMTLELSSLRSQGKRDQIAFFDKECSKVADHIYLGGDFVAKNREILCQHGITHVLNCVGFVCPEYFKSDLVYKTLWLQDSPTEDITSILYDVFDYFEDVRQQGGRVFVHCCQGVSRSTALVIAYLMWRKGQSFDDAFQFVKAARGIANPNMGFACQLLQCQKRVHAIPLSPNSMLRMYRMAPHSPYDPLHLVPKMLNDPSPAALDSRGAFIVHILSSIYVWIGKNCESVMEKDAKAAAFQVVRYERVQGPILMIKEGEEPLDFWGKLKELSSHGGTKIEKVQSESAAKFCVGKRRVDAYDVDFDLFYKALSGGIVPPFSSSGQEYEMHLPARESNWSVLRRKFIPGAISRVFSDSALVRDMDTCSDRMQGLNGETSNSPPYSSPSSFSSDLSTCSKSSLESPSASPSTCSSPFLVLSPSSHSRAEALLLSSGPSKVIPSTMEPLRSSLRAIYSPSKGLAQSIAERRGGFSPLQLSTLCKGALLKSQKDLTSSYPSQNTVEVVDKLNIGETSNHDALGCTNSAGLQSDVKYLGEPGISSSENCGNIKGNLLRQDDQLLHGATGLDVRSEMPIPEIPLVYRWPSREKIETFAMEDLDSRAVFLFVIPNTSRCGEKTGGSVLHLWIGSEFDQANGQTQPRSAEDEQIVSIDWHQVGRDFLDSVGLPKDLPVKIVKEEETVKLLELMNST